MPAERRRAARFDARLWVGIPEADGEPELESCNISASGMLLRTRRDAGTPGEVRMLRLVTADMSGSIEIMAHVIRVIAYEDVELGRVIEATTFEFLAQGDKNRAEIEDFLRQVVEAEFSATTRASVDYHFPVRGPDQEDGARAATASVLGVSRMVIDTTCAVEAGTRVLVDIEVPDTGRSVRLAGRAGGSRHIMDAAEDQRYCVEVSFDEGGDDSAVVNSIVAEAAAPAKRTPRKASQLAGHLSEVGLPSLLGFFELERASGVLRLERESKKADLFVREGNILDVESQPPGSSPIDVLAALLEWPDGTFEFSFEVVDRADAIVQSTSSLLMECAQKSDETNRGF